MTKTYDIIYADPPWQFRGYTQKGDKSPYNSSADSYYPTMSLDLLKRFDVPSIAKKDSLLFLWATSPHLPEAIELMATWKFPFMTVGFVWDKKATNPGYYTLSQCELCLIGKRGRIPQPRGARNVRQFISERRTTHSTKPDEVRHRIEEMFPSQDKVELFARKRSTGWDVWGNEVSSDLVIGERS
jgi:N6-adenosine-specific RNA methylase IME4